MSYSTDCLVGAFHPWLDSLFTVDVDASLDINPFDGDGLSASLDIDINSELAQPERLIAKATAGRFSFRVAEDATFNVVWDLAGPARDLYKEHHHAGGLLDKEVRAAFAKLAEIVNSQKAYAERGYQHVLRVRDSGRFVIFSDHHMAPANNRQSFFITSGNRELYRDILAEYAKSEFTLVENGDVEELLVREPDGLALASRLTLQSTVVNTTDPDHEGWETIDRMRLASRRVQLDQVIADHRDLYDQINEQFVETGRYIRIAGNHDQDLQNPDLAADFGFLEALKAVYPKLQKVYDFVIIEPKALGSPSFVLCHGHHFDLSTNPKYARRIGESLSEYLGWAYQGADRVWKWEGLDGVKSWADGSANFRNTLVSDDPSSFKFTFGDAVAAGFGAAAGVVVGSVSGLAGLGGALGAVATLVDELKEPGFWEGIFNHNVAWEYFRTEDPGEAVLNEVFCGQRWFKFRHLDEIFITAQLKAAFEKNGPYLVLGHSHEPRHEAWNSATGEVASRYLNSGAAGRFENLIWCVEIIDGVPQVAAWHRPDGPQSGKAPERRIYTPMHNEAANQGWLVPSEAHVDLPPLATEASWLEPVLHMMRS